jgi:DNA (cytosine-5)-methyltransferase 1
MTEHSGRRERRNSLVREYFRFVEVLRPRVCMLENVPGLFKTDKGRKYFYELTSGLKRLGYKLTYDILELANYGVPQFRKRLVLLAAKGQAMELPAATHGPPGSPDLEPWKTVRDAIAQLPTPPSRSKVLSGVSKPKYAWHYARDVAPIVRKRLQHALDNGGNRTALPNALKLKCHSADGHYDVYGVMTWDAPSPTITGGCTNASKGRFGHPSEPRPLTAMEAAVLQTFPRSYKFKGPGVESVAAQIGNALPKTFARVMGCAIIDHLMGRNESTRDPRRTQSRPLAEDE